MTTITRNSSNDDVTIDGITFSVKQGRPGWPSELVADFADCDTISIREIEEEEEDDTEISEYDIEMAHEAFAAQARLSAADALESDAESPYAWMLDGISDRVISAWTDDEIVQFVQDQAAVVYENDPHSELYQVLSFAEFLTASDASDARAYIKARRDSVQAEIALNSVVTPQEIADEFGVRPDTVRDAIDHEWLRARKSGGTWLVLRSEAEKRWGKDRAMGQGVKVRLTTE